MGWLDKFKKREEVIDLVNLRKRGLIEDKDIGEEIVDLSSQSATSSQTSSLSDSPLGFLAGLAGASSTESGLSSEGGGGENKEGVVDLGMIGARKKILKEKIKEMERRLDSLSRQLQKTIDRLELMERKLERKGF